MKQTYIEKNLSRETQNYLLEIMRNFAKNSTQTNKVEKKEINDVFNLLFKGLSDEKQDALIVDLLPIYHPALNNSVITKKLSAMSTASSFFGALSDKKKVDVSMLYKLYECENNELFSRLRADMNLSVSDVYTVPHELSRVRDKNNEIVRKIEDLKTNILDLALLRIIKEWDSKATISSIISPLTLDDLKNLGLSEKFNATLLSACRSCASFRGVTELSFLKLKNIDTFISLSGEPRKPEVGFYAIHLILQNRINKAQPKMYESHLNFFEEKYANLLSDAQKMKISQYAVSTFCEKNLFEKIAQKLSNFDSNNEYRDKVPAEQAALVSKSVDDVMEFIKKTKETLKPSLRQMLSPTYASVEQVDHMVDGYLKHKVEKSSQVNHINDKLDQLTGFRVSQGRAMEKHKEVIFEKMTLLLELNSMSEADTVKNRKKNKL